MVDIRELEAEFHKMQQLLNSIPNTIQARIFQNVLNQLEKQLIEAKAKVQQEANSTFQNCSKIFQAIGKINGKIIKRYEDNAKYSDVILNGSKYQLLAEKKEIRDFIRATYNPQEYKYLTVSPNLIYYPQPQGGIKPPKLSFTLVTTNISSTSPQINEFKLCGLFQKIPLEREPVITIYQNKTNDLNFLLQQFPNSAKKILRANHIPILWEHPPVAPFNPESDQDQQGERYFVEVKARFLPHRQKWVFMELLSEPTTEIPKFFKFPIRPHAS